jgi:hypothetical protein
VIPAVISSADAQMPTSVGPAGQDAGGGARAERGRRSGGGPDNAPHSFDHIVGYGEEGGQNDEHERLGGLEVDHQLELGGLHECANYLADQGYFHRL